MPQRLAVVALSLAVAACTSIGLGTVPHDRIDYATSIGNSWKEQTLLNIVKLRYADMPIFLEVAQVIAYQVQRPIGGSFTDGNSPRASSVPSPRAAPRTLRAPTPIGRRWFINRSPASIS